MVAQDVIQLPIEIADPDIQWHTEERQFHSTIWDTDVVTNVAEPSMIVYAPEGEAISDLALIICPGGGLYGHSIMSEGIEVAQYLNEFGVTAFVLKYRLVPTGEDGTKEVMTDGPQVEVKAKQLLPLATSDAAQAIKYVRDNAETFGINPNKIGLMGFSAGGAVTMSLTYSASKDTRPNFIAPIYAWMNIVESGSVPPWPLPAFIACATDDPLRLAQASVQIYQDWVEKRQPAELHMYAEGGHGFGMRKQDLPSDLWIVQFKDWLVGQGLLSSN